MDGTAWEEELGDDMVGTRVYPCIEDMKEAMGAEHLEECGIVEVEVRFVRWAVSPK